MRTEDGNQSSDFVLFSGNPLKILRRTLSRWREAEIGA